MSNANPPSSALTLPPHVQAMSHQEREQRKQWLKRKFGSFEYHEDMLRLHKGFVAVLRKALERARQDQTPDRDYGTKAAFAENFRQSDWPLIQANDDLGKYDKAQWHRFHATATFRSIPDYNRYLISEGDRLGWMTDDEQTELSKFWGPMGRMAQNIKYTVDEMWGYEGTDDWMLDEEYTGPIDWPANWRDEVADLADGQDIRLRVEANQPCPREGWWFTPARENSRRHFQQGESMPDVGSSYGATIWQWDAEQS